MLYRQYADEKQSAEAFDNIAALVQDETPPADEPQESETPQPEQTAFEKYAAVYEQNSDFVGWISIEGTNIDYPVMQTVDNPNYYLKHSFEKQYSDYGVPYVQENCDLGLSDNCVIYGHHMNNGSMFADLCKYADEDFYRAHKTIRFDTLSGFGEYEVVAVFKTAAYSEQGFKYYHFVNADSAEDFDAFIAKCKELALYDTGVTAEYGDRLITLSTCEYSRQNGRMVVVAKRLFRPLWRWAKMKPEKYVLSLSGGKDSTAMLLRLLEENRPVDLILFCDTGLEFPQMYAHLERLEAYIGRPIIRLKAAHDFEYYFYEYTPKKKESRAVTVQRYELARSSRSLVYGDSQNPHCRCLPERTEKGIYGYRVCRDRRRRNKANQGQKLPACRMGNDGARLSFLLLQAGF